MKMTEEIIYSFKVGDADFYLACESRNENEKLFLKSSTLQMPKIPLDIPAPYDNDEIGLVYEDYDSRILEFQMTDFKEDSVKLEISVSTRGGYWYYGSLDDFVPPFKSVSKKRLIVLKQDKDKISCNLENILE